MASPSFQLRFEGRLYTEETNGMTLQLHLVQCHLMQQKLHHHNASMITVTKSG